ncbi:hypothetical protein [Pararhodobacter sp. SW119]|uniref:hypothetical protein n=1 Tax=Pararhodobacter sp. SW119 TaxID=2780075 RepID=UPI001ADEE314|nr:hypothetical protein [Pararhodobacter sp. SW119]
MKGDFSKAAKLSAPNDLGLLYQQGRVITDRDLTAGEIIAQNWRATAARDVIGAGVAAVPATEPDGYRVEAATMHDAHVDVRLAPGRMWADGIPLTLSPDADAPARTFAATYLSPPANAPGTDVGSIGAGIRDAVILEVVLDTLNGFQEPERLIEAALGGPDTAQRIHPRQRLRLLRLAPAEDCTTIGPRLRDDPALRGRLSVTLEAPTTIPGDCPVVDGGGYSGFEHNLYRIEIAETADAPVLFKWSSLNGGLVGRGRVQGGATPRVELSGNRTAIINSGLSEFYLEALEYTEHFGYWRVVYGAPATLNADGNLNLTTPATFGTMPGAGGPVFFRLWNGIAPISAFTGGPTPLRAGIELHFTSTPAAYRAEDFWTFDLRAGEIVNPEILHDDAPPEGPIRHRVPLAEISWTDRRDTDHAGAIEDCRRRFRPLTNQKTCCTWLVGNGVSSFGDFNSLDEAVAHLPESGGQVCLLPGVHLANLRLIGRRNIKIHGCRERTMVLPRPDAAADPVIRIEGGSEVEIADLDFFAPFGIAVDATGEERAPLRNLTIRDCRALSLAYGFRVERAEKVRITGNRIWMLDHASALSAISLRARDALVERNVLAVWPHAFTPPVDDDEAPERERTPDPADPCLEPEKLYGNLKLFVAHVLMVWTATIVATPEQPYRARGGLHLRGGCDRIDVIANRIAGGASHGIVLGGAYASEMPATEAPETPPSPRVFRLPAGPIGGRAQDEDGEPVAGVALTLINTSGNAVQSRVSAPPNGVFVFEVPATGGYFLEASEGYQVVEVDTDAASARRLVVTLRRVAATDRRDTGFLTRIRIIDNTIERMGLSGIGFLLHGTTPTPPPPPERAGPAALAEFVAELVAPRELICTTNLIRDLEVRGNRIQDNLRLIFTPAMRALAPRIAQGGISLPLVEGLRITDNHITGNGTSAANPCAGIFVGYGEEVILSGNYIAGNGPLGSDYDTAGIEGLRGGVVVRMASAMIAGGAADARERPALDIRDNHIDQPAGRAITAFAFGPVSCVGNHLNSEREGRWSFVDRFAGAVLIANLGGLHRQFEFLGHTAFEPGRTHGDTRYTTGLAARAPAEDLLPGGEVMFNSNRVRTGSRNRAYSATLIATCDDLGFDSNQSAIFKSDAVFTNLTAIGLSVRITDNRFRERARSTAMSALSMSFGLGEAGRLHAMNIATHNQADHCVIATSNGPPIGQPVLETPNQVVYAAFCPIEAPDKARYLLAALAQLMRLDAQPDLEIERAGADLSKGLSHTVVGFGDFQQRMTVPKAAEAERVRHIGGAQPQPDTDLRLEILQRQAAAEALQERAHLATVREVAEPAQGGLVIDGRIADAHGRGVAAAEVELIDGRGRSLDIGATTDRAGYYALSISAEMRANLASMDNLTIRTRLGDADPASIPATQLLRSSDERQRIDIPYDPLKEFRFELPPRSPFRPTDPTGPQRPTDPPLRPDPVRPDPVRPDPVRPDPIQPVPPRPTPTPQPVPPIPTPQPERPPRPDLDPATPRLRLEVVDGIGPAIAERLRNEGIADTAALLDTPIDRLESILGRRAETIRNNARIAVRDARDRPNGG